MSDILTSSKLIKSIKRRASIPVDQRTFTDQDLLEMATEEMNLFLIPYLNQGQEEYLIYQEDESTVTGQDTYSIPYRAQGNKLRDLQYVDNSGNVIAELSRISMEELVDYKYNYRTEVSDLFYIQNNKIKLVNEFPGANVSLRKYFYIRPNAIVEEKRVGKIQSIDTNNGIITLESFPDNFSNIPEMDFIGTQSPCVILNYDVTPLNINKNTRSVTFNVSDIPADLQVGDYLCQKQESPLPQLPSELHPILAQRVAIACLESLGDEENKQSQERRLMAMEKSVDILIDDRVEGAQVKIKNRHSTLRQANNFGSLRNKSGSRN